jgi:hypothetical protein
MSLFRKLQWLYRSDTFQFEDFHTEIVAQVLKNSPSLTLAWLRAIGATTLTQAAHVELRTQETFPPLAHHSTPSRPDITIRLFSESKTELVFVESKLNSAQWGDQLQRYADHLHAAQRDKGVDEVALVFITRDFEAAETPLLADPRFQLNFQPTRWFQFYLHLKAHGNGDGLATELKLFMEENRMSLGHQFRSTDLVALENFFSAKALMDETLEGEVSEAMRGLPGGLYAVRRGLTYFRDDHRYVASNDNWKEIECHVGYWLPHEKPDEGVWVGITLYNTPFAPARDEVIAAFRSWVKRGGEWTGEELDNPKAKSAIYKGTDLQALMGGPDHVQAIKDYLLSLLKEVEMFRKSYPNLRWCRADAAESDDHVATPTISAESREPQ